MANKLLIKSQSIYFLPSYPFLFSKHSNICFAISFCILAFPLGGFIRNMSNQKNFIMAATGGNYCLERFWKNSSQCREIRLQVK